MSSVVHVFYDVYMGYSHGSLRAIMQESAKKHELAKNEVAVFLNKSWTACKILVNSDALFYYKSKAPLTVETIRFLPTMFGGSRLSFQGKVESHVIKAFESKLGKQMKRIKVAYA